MLLSELREKVEKLPVIFSYLLPEASVSDIMHTQINFQRGPICDAF